MLLHFTRSAPYLNPEVLYQAFSGSLSGHHMMSSIMRRWSAVRRSGTCGGAAVGRVTINLIRGYMNDERVLTR